MNFVDALRMRIMTRLMAYNPRKRPYIGTSNFVVHLTRKPQRPWEITRFELSARDKNGYLIHRRVDPCWCARKKKWELSSSWSSLNLVEVFFFLVSCHLPFTLLFAIIESRSFPVNWFMVWWPLVASFVCIFSRWLGVTRVATCVTGQLSRENKLGAREWRR